MSYIHVPHVQPMEHRTLFQLLRVQAKAHPNKEAFVFRDTTKNRIPITFQECENKSQSLAIGLLHIGLSRGDRVLVMVPSCPEFVFVYLALNRIGAIAIIDEEDSHSTIKNIKNLSCVISKTDYRLPLGQKVVQEILSLLQERETFKAILINPENVGDLVKENRLYTYGNLLTLAENYQDSQAMLLKAEEKVQMDDPFLVLFTSGSTSAPKPIEYTHHHFVVGTVNDGSLTHLTNASRIFSDSPFDWTPGISIICSSFLYGCTMIVFPPKLVFKGGYSTTILQIIAEEKCTNWVPLGYAVHDLLLQENIHAFDLSNLRYCEIGGQPMSLPVLKKLFELIPDLIVGLLYASTETRVLAKQDLNKHNIDVAELGYFDVSPGLEIRIIDEDEQLVPIGSEGKLS